ncbi:helix-turn-helix transcriptional regulator [Natrinema sp. LN54]|uniref:helix-turn-helix transcriptional regulator n=1 Tax=Natrinema sp. LN54 TaxID=3458705 RepID=UPI004035DF9C
MDDGEKLRDTLRKRTEILRALLNNPQTKSDLTEEVSASRSTIDRAIKNLQDLRCVGLQGGEYHLTSTGKLSLETYENYVDTTDNLSDIHQIINSISGDMSIERDFIKGASKHLADPQVPETALREANELLKSATKLTGLAPLSLPSYPDLLEKEIQENDLEVEIIVEEKVLESLHEVRGESFENFVADDNVDIYTTGRSLPCAVWIMETPEGEHAGTTVYNQGGVQGVIINDKEAAVQWARETYEKYLESSSKIDNL